MARQQDQYEDALGSVFDFIYSQSQKPPSKVKPMKVTGVDGTSEFVEALTAVVENPLLFVNEATMESFKEALDVNMAKFSIGDRGGGVAFNLQDIGTIVKDPKAYVDKAFTKIEGVRKMQRAAHAGEAMRSVLGGMWARKMGLDWDTQRGIIAAGNMTEGGIGRSPGFSLDMMSRNKELMERHFVSKSRSLTEKDFMERYKRHDNDREGAKIATRMYEKYKKAAKVYSENDQVEMGGLYGDKELYAFLEGTEMKYKEASATTEEEKSKYASAGRFVDHMSMTADLRKYRKDAKEDMKGLLNQIEELKKTSGTGKEIAELRSRLRDLKSNMNFVGAYELVGNLGRWEGQWNTAKTLFNGDLLPNIINGNFFEDKYNQISWLQPTKTAELWSGKEILDEKGKLSKLNMECHFAKMTGNKFTDSFYQSMTSLYYLSPATWVKTLATGEGFTYMAKMAEKRFKKEMGSVLGSVSGFDMDGFLGEIMKGNGNLAINNLQGISAESIKRIEKFAKKYERLGKLGHNFGALARFRDKIQAVLEKKLFRAVRLKVGKALLKVGFINQFSKHAVMAWMKNGGMYTLLKGVVTATLKAIGFSVAGPIGSFVVTVASTLLSDFLLKAAKPVLKFGAEIFSLLFFGIFFGTIFLFGSFFTMIFGQHSHVAPQEIVYCDTSYGLDYIIDDPDNPGGVTPQGSMEPFVAGALPSGEQCLLGTGAYRCTQGPYDSYSHSNVAAIDVGGVNYFHAPAFCGNGGTCKITYVGDVHCSGGYAGGMVKFTAEYKGQTYEFKLIHVDTNLSTGQSLSSGERVARIMEWHETGSACSSGKHLHLETRLNGAVVNPYDVMTKPVSEGGFGCGLSPC